MSVDLDVALTVQSHLDAKDVPHLAAASDFIGSFNDGFLHTALPSPRSPTP